MDVREIKHFHLFCGLGGGAAGFNAGEARVGAMVAKFRCIGGIDSDAGAVADFGRLAGVPATLLDLFSREQYIAFHGKPPPAGWREATPQDLHRAAGHERPNIIFTSPPCKGFSGLLSEALSRTGKYQALNELTLRGLWLAMEAWHDDPPEFVLLENVPRISNRGRHLLDQIQQLLAAYGYAVAETTHDCGELGGLAQTRKRFLLVARHREKVPPFLYEPEKRPLRAVGEVLEKFPMPGAGAAGPMHRLPALHWKTWVRLAFVEAGSDWRSLRKLRVVDGKLADYLIVPDMHRGVLGVTPWEKNASTVTGNSLPLNGSFAVGDPRVDGHPKAVHHGVMKWADTAGVVTSKMMVGGGRHAVQDPRLGDGPAGPHFNNVYRVVEWKEHAPTISAGSGPSAGGIAVQDPRPTGSFNGKGKYRVTGFGEPSNTVIAASTTGNGASAVADPRVGYSPNSHRNKLAIVEWHKHARTVTGGTQVQGGALSVADPRPAGLDRAKGDHYLTGGHFGVVPWSRPSNVVSGNARHDNGFNNVADPRLCSYCTSEGCTFPDCDFGRKPLPQAAERLVCVIRATDGTWHRPFTTLELAALQSLVEPEEHLELCGLSDSAWRERIGNAVPRLAAAAIAGVVGRTLLLAWAGETFALGSTPIWVRPVAVALAVDIPGGLHA
jgi:site-specific DNA-cytosine methylase